MTLGLQVVGKFIHSGRVDMGPPVPKSLEEAFYNLPTSLQQLCGSAHFPPDDDKDIIDNIPVNQCIFGASDASFQKDRGSHAWIVSTGNISDIQNDHRHISGSGPVHGFTHNISAGQEGLQGLTAASIISQLLMQFHRTTRKLDVICDNQGMTNQCSNISFISLRSHRESNVDLFLTHNNISKTIPTTIWWFRSHSDKQKWESIEDLEQQQLS